MRYTPVSGFPIFESENADPEIAQKLIEAQQVTNLPYVPNWAKLITISPGAFNIYLEMYKSFTENISLPQSIVPIILYTVAEARNCTYCSTTNAHYCRTLGIDDKTLETIAHDLDNLTPKRLRIIIRFAMKCAFDPQGLVTADYDEIRDEGISDDEISQIIFLAALANFNDTLADSFKIEVEPDVLKALES